MEPTKKNRKLARRVARTFGVDRRLDADGLLHPRGGGLPGLYLQDRGDIRQARDLEELNRAVYWIRRRTRRCPDLARNWRKGLAPELREKAEALGATLDQDRGVYVPKES